MFLAQVGVVSLSLLCEPLSVQVKDDEHPIIIWLTYLSVKLAFHRRNVCKIPPFLFYKIQHKIIKLEAI